MMIANYDMTSKCGTYRVNEDVLFEGKEMNIVSFPDEITVELEDEMQSWGESMRGIPYLKMVSIWNIQKITPEMRKALDEQYAQRRAKQEQESKEAMERIRANQRNIFVKAFHYIASGLQKLIGYQ